MQGARLRPHVIRMSEAFGSLRACEDPIDQLSTRSNVSRNYGRDLWTLRYTLSALPVISKFSLAGLNATLRISLSCASTRRDGVPGARVSHLHPSHQ